MVLGSEKSAIEPDRLALIAATAQSTRGLLAWTSLVKNLQFENLPPNAQRLCPMIYNNLSGERSVPEIERLKGSFRFSWAASTKLLYEVVRLTDSLEREKIDYRILKGLGIQLSLDLVGARVVGDADILVKSKDIQRVSELLTEMGFRKSSGAGCDHGFQAPLGDALEFNKADVHFDLHIAEFKEPASLFARMFEEEPLLRTFQNQIIQIPSPELLLLHSAYHGFRNSSPTDLIQSLADIVQLARVTNDSHLTEITKSSGCSRYVDFIKKSLVDYLDEESELLEGVADARVELRNHSAKTKGGVSRLTRKALQLLKVRSIFPLALANPKRFFYERVHYTIWLLAGQFSALEKKLFSFLPLFLKPPRNALREGISFQYFGSETPDSISLAAFAHATLDLRFRAQFVKIPTELFLSFSSSALDLVGFAVHVGGTEVARLVPGEQRADDIHVIVTTRHCEISLRPLPTACRLCARAAIEDLRISVSVVEPAA